MSDTYWLSSINLSRFGSEIRLKDLLRIRSPEDESLVFCAADFLNSKSEWFSSCDSFVATSLLLIFHFFVNFTKKRIFFTYIFSGKDQAAINFIGLQLLPQLMHFLVHLLVSDLSYIFSYLLPIQNTCITQILFFTLLNVYFVKYDVTVSFMAQVLDTVAYLVSHVLVVDTVTYFDIFR